jgi:cytoskeleton protein RodZ
MADLGRQLRQARQSAGLSLEALAARTKITMRALEAIERGDFEQLPGGVFTRSFIRSYAREVGMSPDQAIAEYRAESGTQPSPSLVQPPPDTPPSESLPKRRRAIWSGWTIAAILLVSVFSVLVIRNIRGVNVVHPDTVATTGTSAGRAEDIASSARSNSSVGQPVVETRRDVITLEIAPTALVWLDIRADGQRAMHGLLQAGEHKTIEAHQDIVARIGDAGAFHYSINGRAGRSLGASQQIRDIRITRDNLAEFTPQQ